MTTLRFLHSKEDTPTTTLPNGVQLKQTLFPKGSYIGTKNNIEGITQGEVFMKLPLWIETAHGIKIRT